MKWLTCGRATNLPRMDAGLGSCDPYVKLLIGDYNFTSKTVFNTLDPQFKQTFRIGVPLGRKRSCPAPLTNAFHGHTLVQRTAPPLRPYSRP